MITAKEAHKRTKESVANSHKKAAGWVKEEWEAFIEPKIEEAIAKGKYEASYWWSNEILQEAGIDKHSAAQELRNCAYDLGFHNSVWENFSNNNVLRIEIRWEKV